MCFCDGLTDCLCMSQLPLAQDIPYFNLYFTLRLAPGVGSFKAGLTLTRS